MLLPVTDKLGNRFGADCFNRIRRELTQEFGGVTAYSRAPAEGHWDSGKSVERDDVMVVEVVVDTVDENWWTDYRKQLEKRFGQDRILMRAISCRII
jgi:hypothetical protein